MKKYNDRQSMNMDRFCAEPWIRNILPWSFYRDRKEMGIRQKLISSCIGVIVR